MNTKAREYVLITHLYAHSRKFYKGQTNKLKEGAREKKKNVKIKCEMMPKQKKFQRFQRVPLLSFIHCEFFYSSL